MTPFMKRLVSLFMGASTMVVLAACGTFSIEFPTPEVTAVPTNTAGIPVTGGDLVNLIHTQWTLVSF